MSPNVLKAMITHRNYQHLGLLSKHSPSVDIG